MSATPAMGGGGPPRDLLHLFAASISTGHVPQGCRARITRAGSEGRDPRAR
jgi:hypothetical protein